MGYPVILDVVGKSCVIIGGGKVATRKAQSLIDSGAVVTIISPEITSTIEEWVREGLVIYNEKLYTKDDIKDAFIVIAATGDELVNEQIKNDVSNFQLLNVIDVPDKGNFTVPAVLRKGKLLLTISTSGASPGLARQIKNELSTLYDESYEEYIDFLYECRRYVKKAITDQKIRNKILKGLLDPTFLQLTKQGKIEQRKQKFELLLQQFKMK